MTADSSGLGTKPVARLALTMSVPTIVAQAANASYTIIDRLFIGHIPEVGDAAMTGVGICFPILLAVTAFASLIGAGGAPRASIELGRGNFKKAERILGTSAAFLVAIALTLTVILQATKEPVLRAFGASDANIGYAVDFITIYLVGTVFVQLTLGLNNFISAQGKTTVAMTSVLIGTGTSIILDPVFIFVLGWGVKGRGRRERDRPVDLIGVDHPVPRLRAQRHPVETVQHPLQSSHRADPDPRVGAVHHADHRMPHQRGVQRRAATIRR